MISKSLLFFRKTHGSSRGERSDAGTIVLLMMALVFVPIITAHMVLAWHGDLPLQQLSSMMHALFPAF